MAEESRQTRRRNSKEMRRSKASSWRVESAPKSGIDFVCSRCGTVLYHVGVGEGRDSSAYEHRPLSEILRNCSNCGRELDFDVNADLVKISAVKENQPTSPEALSPVK